MHPMAVLRMLLGKANINGDFRKGTVGYLSQEYRPGTAGVPAGQLLKC